MANWGVHYCDAIRWVLEEEAPISISAHGGRFALKDDRTVPDTLQVTFELPSGALLIFGQYEANGGRAIVEGELEFRGTLGNLYTGSEGNGYKVVPTSRGQFQEGESPAKALEEQRLDGDLTEQHVRNFVDCVKSRKTPNCDLETGHRSTSFALLANIALATKSRIDWDAKKERVNNNDQANELLSYEYRKPWTLG
jgi:predicted dehydrogenase